MPWATGRDSPWERTTRSRTRPWAAPVAWRARPRTRGWRQPFAPIHVLIGDDAHTSVFSALQFLGLGHDRVVRIETDAAGRSRRSRRRTLPRHCPRPSACGKYATRYTQHPVAAPAFKPAGRNVHLVAGRPSHRLPVRPKHGRAGCLRARRHPGAPALPAHASLSGPPGGGHGTACRCPRMSGLRGGSRPLGGPLTAMRIAVRPGSRHSGARPPCK